MKALTILGSTGSIGSNAIDIVKKFPDQFTIKAVAAKSNIDELADQIRRFSPDVAVVYGRADAKKLEDILPKGTKTDVLFGPEGYVEAARHPDVDMVLGAMVGAAGLEPTLAAIEAGKDIALANKETLVMAGGLVMKKAKASGIKLLPVDSEHSAVFQSLIGHRKIDLQKIILTASGGPFLNRPFDTFGTIQAEDALNHPNWEMGKKISIDSATMMNKGLEVIEAKWLFDLSHEAINVLIHPQSIVHSMASYRDGAVVSQMGVPDMKMAIAYALAFPERLDIGVKSPVFEKIGSLTFQTPDFEKFPCLKLAYRACRIGGTMPAVLNAANEIAVQAFLDNRITFLDIHKTVKETMDQHVVNSDDDLACIMGADRWARTSASAIINNPDSGDLETLV